jgi:hypothetical protein
MTKQLEGLEMPEGLCHCGKAAVQTIVNLLKREGATYTGGCKSFYSPRDWADRGESYGHGSVLIVMHEGAASGPYFSLDKSYPVYATHTKMSKVLDKAGFFFEECTGYYVAVYAKEEA